MKETPMSRSLGAQLLVASARSMAMRTREACQLSKEQGTR
jgi:hypothetical protein